MNIKKALVYVTAIAVLTFVALFDVEWVFDLGSETNHEVPDPVIEQMYENCYATKDDAMHRQAFGTIDNPNVQREFISANRAEIARQCRTEFPENLISIERNAPFNLVDVHPRFW